MLLTLIESDQFDTSKLETAGKKILKTMWTIFVTYNRILLVLRHLRVPKTEDKLIRNNSSYLNVTTLVIVEHDQNVCF